MRAIQRLPSQIQCCLQARMYCTQSAIETTRAMEIPAILPNTIPGYQPLLSDEEVATILAMTLDWSVPMRTTSRDSGALAITSASITIPFSSGSADWRSSFRPKRLLRCSKSGKSWIYANADQIPGSIRLGRYLRFRPAVIRAFLGWVGGCPVITFDATTRPRLKHHGRRTVVQERYQRPEV